MPLSWNEIRARAAKFSDEWKDAHYEKGETQTFYNEFFDVFGMRRRHVAVYEEKVKKLSGNHGFVDLFWPSNLLIEQKSAGRDLAKAREQATDYFLSITEKEKPRFILLSDFQTFELLDLEENQEYHFTLAELHDNIRHFAFIAGYQQQKYRDQDPANIEASELMSNLHKLLEESGYTGHDLEHLLVRIMFCQFAEDTGIFPMESFLRLIEDRTEKDGSDLGSWLIHLFQVLNTSYDKRQHNLDEDLGAFPWVNGQLFANPIKIPSFDTEMRDALLQCTYFNWTKVSPALFGSLFQTVMLPAEQRQGGAHYTSEKNILKVIQPLFLDELREEFEHIQTLKVGRKKRCRQLQDKISKLIFFDPACGCGNFLILAFREIRELELDILVEINPTDKHGIETRVLDVGALTKVSVDQFYGIEIEEFPARIAEAAMWLVDHQLNMKLSDRFGQAFVRLPLTESAHIHHGNALTTDWANVLSPKKCTYILGNPPFIGYSYRTKEQAKETEDICGTKNLDYVACWYIKAAQFIKNSQIKCALVSTNSICQGEQVSALWGKLINEFGIKIHFAHKTFKWTIDEKKAKGMRIAAVFVIIVGFARFNKDKKYLFEYEKVTSEPHKIKAQNINPYLVDGDDIIIKPLPEPLSTIAPRMQSGSASRDGGFLICTDDEKQLIVRKDGKSEEFFRRFISGNDFINNKIRWCIWLKNVSPEKFKHIQEFQERFKSVRAFREDSARSGTKKMANLPYLFAEERQPEDDFLLIPKVSSENRTYIPIAYLSKDYIITDKTFFVPNATPYHFGVISSLMHMTWMRYVCGRLKSDYSYSNTIVYNNFPWPELTDKDKENIVERAQEVLNAREQFPDSNLADLYDPNITPHLLLKAHQSLDKAIDKAYRKAAFKDEKERIEFLFERYQKLTAPLIESDKTRGRRKV